MALFLGTHSPRLDEKGRIFLPAKFRDDLAEGLVVTRGQERCLYVFPVEEFERRTSALREAPLSAKAIRDYTRLLHSGGESEKPDKQGRITLPERLRTYAGLTKECVVIGAGDHVEIWDAVAWETYLDEQEAAYADRDEEVVPGLI